MGSHWWAQGLNVFAWGKQMHDRFWSPRFTALLTWACNVDRHALRGARVGGSPRAFLRGPSRPLGSAKFVCSRRPPPLAAQPTARCGRRLVYVDIHQMACVAFLVSTMPDATAVLVQGLPSGWEWTQVCARPPRRLNVDTHYPLPKVHRAVDDVNEL